ncbi:MAG: DUF3450 domain-containing protein [Pseudomonadales bacterium]|nr:DUF3450 domain-containing protein [Pseudomonadales bacterium]MDP7596027.1 DUF3450 domain-containing protein [Pseudomonadales bacterium]HJN53026.1 DUF3450 domain-containing protein [Pseudomonadales bacterium]
MSEYRIGSTPAVLLLALVSVFSTFSVTGETQSESDLLNQYMQVRKIADSLQVYNQQQQQLVSSQEKEMATLSESIDNVKHMARQIPPLLEAMVANLGKFIELDLPFRMTERQAYLTTLRNTMERADIAVSEKFILVMAAYERETEYANSYETYSDVINLNGNKRQVDVLRFGRVSLSFQTPDFALTGVWNNQTREWQVLDDEFRDEVRHGIRIAANALTEDLVGLPVAAPEDRR